MAPWYQSVLRHWRRAVCLPAAAIACLALSAGVATAQDEREPPGPVFQALFDDPTNIELNLRYAAAMEESGQYRKALATYERVLLLDPDNAEARAGLSRMRFLLAPNFTNFRLTFGGGYESNPLQQPDFEPRPASGLALFALRARDERRIGSLRWRSHAFGGGEFFPDAQEVNQLFVGGDVGPLIPVSSFVQVRPSLVGTYRSLDGVTLFGEVGGALEAEGIFEGALQAARLAAVYRTYGEEWVSGDGVVVDLTGRFARPGVIFPQDSFFFRPNVRYSGVGNDEAALFVPTPFTPGQFVQLGGIFDYVYALGPQLSVGANFAIYQRWFSEPAAFGEDDRRDTYLSPGAFLTVGNIFLENVDLTVDYMFERNISNADFRDFDNHRVTARIGVDF